MVTDMTDMHFETIQDRDDEHEDLFADDQEEMGLDEHESDEQTGTPAKEAARPARKAAAASAGASAAKERRRAQRTLIRKALDTAARFDSANPRTRAAACLLLGSTDDTADLVMAALDGGANDAKKVLADVESMRGQVKSDPFEAFAALISFESSQRARFKAVWDVVAVDVDLPKSIPSNPVQAAKSLAQGLGEFDDDKLGVYRDAVKLIG